MRSKVIEMENIVKKFNIGTPNELTVLKGLDMEVYEGEFVSVVGTSGSGKSTLMNIIGALDRPTSGKYLLGNELIADMSNDKLSSIRNKKIGFVFQSFNLIPRSSALENVELPMLYAGMGKAQRRERAIQLLEMVGMGDRVKHLPNELSGGQMQRVAIARAMANNPDIILADEPTGALDTETSRLVMNLFHALNQDEGKTIVLITHNPELAEETGKVFRLSDGEIIDVQETGYIHKREED